MSGRLEGRLALITGASRGIGAAVAKRYAREGAHVILVARTVGGLEEVDDAIQADGGTATLAPLDLTEMEKIDELGGRIYERFGKLDILVGNAGLLGELTPVHQMTPETWERVIAVNLTANWRLIRSVDPLLRASDAGRAIFVTSGVAKSVFPYWVAYSASKAALEMLAYTYAAENQKTGIRVNVLDPGVVRTDMRAQAFPGEDPMTLPDPDSVTERFVKLAEPSFGKTGQRYTV